MMPDSPRRSTAFAGLLVFLLLLTAAHGAAKGSKEDKDAPAKPGIDLRADPSVGFTPVVATLTGELTGVDPLDGNFCHPAVVWVRIDPGGSEETASRLRQDPVCRHGEEETQAKVYFTRQFSLERPGAYLFRLVIEGKDGTVVRSDYAGVRVLRVQ